MLNLSWGVDLWDCLDPIINHSNTSSLLIDKVHKCFIECNSVWTKAAHKQKRLLDKLQTEIKDSALDEFTLTASLLSLINNLTSICNIGSTFHDSVGKAAEEHLKKPHSQIKKQTSTWSMEKRKMEDDLARERRKYDMALKRYRDKYQALLMAQDNVKRSEENRALSKSQIDMCHNSLYMKQTEYDEAKRDYAFELTNFNDLQQSHFSKAVVDWAKKGEKLYDQRLSLLKNVSTELAKYTGEMIKNLNYSITRFNDIANGLSLEKDAILLVQKYKTGDVPPGELQFIDLDNKQYSMRPANNIVDTRQRSDGSSSSGSSTSSFESTVNDRQHSVYAGSLSSMPPMSTNTRSEPGRPSVQSMKMRNTGKIVNPEAKLSIKKSTKIFHSTTPWKTSTSTNKAPLDKQKSIYQRRGRSSMRDQEPQRRSHSVSEMITNAFRSSLRLKSNPDIDSKAKRKTNGPEIVVQSSVRQDSSDYDTDTSRDQCRSETVHAAPEIVSTPAEAVAMTHRKYSAPDYTITAAVTDSVDAPVEDQTEEEQDVYETNVDENYDYPYVGSCASYHDYDSEDPSNKYLSFKTGDQFYIITMDEGSGWLFVETVDRATRGYVPASYMAIQHFDKLADDVI